MYAYQWGLRRDVSCVQYKRVFTINEVTITRVYCTQSDVHCHLPIDFPSPAIEIRSPRAPPHKNAHKAEDVCVQSLLRSVNMRQPFLALIVVATVLLGSSRYACAQINDCTLPDVSTLRSLIANQFVPADSPIVPTVLRKWHVTIPLMLSYSISRRHLTAGVLVLRHPWLLLRHLWLLLRHLLEIISPNN